MFGQRGEAGFAGDGRPGAALLPERRIEVFERDLGFGGIDLFFQRGGELALLTDGFQHGLAPGSEVGEIGETGREVAQLGIVEAAGPLLPVTRDEGNSGAFADQIHSGGNLLVLDIQFACDDAGDGRSSCGHARKFLSKATLRLTPGRLIL